MISTDSSAAVGITNDTRSSRSLAKMNQVLTMKLGQSGSIRNLISFYEATYNKKRTNTNNKTTLIAKATSFDKPEPPSTLAQFKYERHISSPAMSHSKAYSKSSLLNLPASPLSSPGFSPSPSSSSASSTEKLSFTSGSYNSESSTKKDKTNSGKDTEMKSASLLWSISTTSSSSSGFSSGFSSPSQSEAPTSFVTEAPKKPTTATKPAKKTNSISNLAEQLIGKKKLTSLKSKHSSMNKLFESKRSKQAKQKQVNSQTTMAPDATKEAAEVVQTTHQPIEQRSALHIPAIERPSDLTLFKSIKKVLHTVKLCKLEKFSPLELAPEKRNESSSTEELDPQSTVLTSDTQKSTGMEAKLIPDRSDSTQKVQEEEEQKIKPGKEKKALEVSRTEAERTDVQMSDRSKKTVGKDNQQALHVTNGFKVKTQASKASPAAPSWSSQMSTSYSFSNTRQPVTRSQSQTYVKTNNNNRRYDPRNAQKIVLEWCQHHTRNYPNVSVANFSSSWSDGLAFCALIHNFLPDSFDYETLTAADRRHNFELAFETASSKANVMPLLEVDDMLRMGNRPDDRCVFTYVSTIFSRFQARSTTKNNSNKENTVNSSKHPNIQKSISMID